MPIHTTVQSALYSYCPAELVRAKSLSSKCTTRSANARKEFSQITLWTSFDKDIAAYTLSEQELQLATEVHDMPRSSVADEQNVCAQFQFRIESPIEAVMSTLCANGPRFEFCSPIARRPSLLFDPDRVLFIERNVDDSVVVSTVMVGELKTPWALVVPDNAKASFLIDQYSSESSRGGNNKFSRAIMQLYGYMSFNHLRYGFLSNYEHSFFFRRADPAVSDGILQVSRPIHRRDIVRIMVQFCRMLLNNPNEIDYKSPQGTPIMALDERILNPRRRKAEIVLLAANNYLFKQEISNNSRGSVYLGRVSGIDRDVVFKLIDISKQSEGAADMRRESEIYVKLSTLQGKIIPNFHGIVDFNGLFWGLIMDNIEDGKEISEECFEKRIDEIIEMAQKVHRRGCVHGDLDCKNILQDSKGKLWLVDFGNGQLNATKEQKEEEMARLFRIKCRA